MTAQDTHRVGKSLHWGHVRNDAAEHSGHRLSMVQTVYGPDLSGRAAHVQKRDESQRDVQDQDTSRFKQEPLKRMRSTR